MPSRVASGVFVTLEGGDGSGKSTLAQALAARLRAEGFTVRSTEEPAGTQLGRRVWEAFKERDVTVAPTAELLFFEAARAQHVAEVIRPALESGEIVLCDRFSDSSIAYQSYGRGLDLELVQALNDVATGGLKPNLTVLLDIPPESSLARADAEMDTQVKDAIGQESLAFHQRVRDGFLALARSEPARFVVIDATLPAATVTEAAWRSIRGVLRPPA